MEENTPDIASTEVSNSTPAAEDAPQGGANDAAAAAEPAAPETASKAGGARRTVLVLSLFLTLFLPALDQTIVSTALPRILSDLGAASSGGYYAWVGTAFALAQAVVQPAFGQAAEALGRKGAFLAAVAVFTLGSALCGAARSAPMLVAARVVQGAGGGGITSLVYILIGDLVGTRCVGSACDVLTRGSSSSSACTVLIRGLGSAESTRGSSGPPGLLPRRLAP